MKGYYGTTQESTNANEERAHARITVATFAHDQTDLKELLAMLGLGLTADEWSEWQKRKGWC